MTKSQMNKLSAAKLTAILKRDLGENYWATARKGRKSIHRANDLTMEILAEGKSWAECLAKLEIR